MPTRRRVVYFFYGCVPARKSYSSLVTLVCLSPVCLQWQARYHAIFPSTLLRVFEWRDRATLRKRAFVSFALKFRRKHSRSPKSSLMKSCVPQNRKYFFSRAKNLSSLQIVEQCGVRLCDASAILNVSFFNSVFVALDFCRGIVQQRVQSYIQLTHGD